MEAPLRTKRVLAPLWMPCLTQEQVHEILAMTAPPYAVDANALAEQVRYWDDVQQVASADDIDPEAGEIFFKPTDGYQLIPVHE
ncbi:hypothetical protein [Salinisphaera hydrothermalis]|uniref:hypothetical protein n=1 Tax=Salinisphaera hydrothermalis TaxID=563188 RepID=UPI003342386F